MSRVLPIPTTATCAVRPPKLPILRLLRAMLLRHDQDIIAHKAGPNTGHNRTYPIQKHAFEQLCTIIAPAWIRGETVAVTFVQATTLMGAIAAFETLALEHFEGSRIEQRRACQKADPMILGDITSARSWIRSFTFVAPDGENFAFA